jgi:hypothetical protein
MQHLRKMRGFPRDVAGNVPTESLGKSSEYYSSISPKAGSLSVVIRSFKSAVTKRLREEAIQPDGSIWQSRYFDRIIRNDTEYFFISRYIEMNPFLWHADFDNPEHRDALTEQSKEQYFKQHGINGAALAYVLKLEIDYRDWWRYAR